MHRDQTEAPGADLSFRDLMAVVKRQRLIVLSSVAVLLGLAVAVSMATPPKYRSTSAVLIEEAPKLGVVDVSDPMMSMQPQESTLTVPTRSRSCKATTCFSPPWRASG